MTYTKTNWNTGDVITSEKLNKMEDGIADSNVFLIEATCTADPADSTQRIYLYDVTYNDILTAYSSGKDIRLHLTITDASNGTVLSDGWMPCTNIHYGKNYDFPNKYEAAVDFGGVSFNSILSNTLEEALALHPANPPEYKPVSEPGEPAE